MAGRKNVPLKVLRLLDANLNRCREGLRVLEDTARFVWDDEPLFLRFRHQRHSVDLLTRKFYPKLVASRDSRGDHGRTIPEAPRARFQGVVAANLRRSAESLRVLEEYGKLFSPASGARFKIIRFEIYDLEKKVLGKEIGKR